VKAYYEDVWADAPDGPPWAWKWRSGLLSAEARAGERVLDLGCGAGHFLSLLRGVGADPVGVDLSERALVRARAREPSAETHLLGADGSIPLAHGSIDLVWCSEVIEHVADVGGLLAEIRRVLRPGGRLLLTTPFHGRVKGALLALTRFDAHFDPLGQHLRFFTRSSLTGALDAARLEVAGVAVAGGLPLLRETLVARASRPGPQPLGSAASSARRASSTSDADEAPSGSR
jgi:SAM-dependent methyltransferase